MTRALVLFEDDGWEALRPLTELLPVPALACGGSTLARRWHVAAGLPLLAIEARALALEAWRERPAVDPDAARGAADAPIFAANAAALPGPWLEEARGAGTPALFTSGGRIVAGRLPRAQLEPGLGRGAGFAAFLAGLGLPRVEVAARLLAHPWDFVERNRDALARDLAAGPFEQRGKVHRLAALEAPEAIAIEEGATIEAHAVLDARGGPIRIERGARVAAHTLVEGPCVVGAGSELLGGRIAQATIGPRCFIAGEVEASIWQGYSNKRHHGFVGHSVIGEWVNLGALTTTSDLKNNYGPVRVTVGGREMDSGLTKVGAFIGAHTKTGIGSLLPTGAVIGTASNLFGGGRFAPKHVPPFTWWDGERASEHRLEALLETARHAMARRERPLVPADERALRALFESSASERGVAPAPRPHRKATAAS